MKIVIGLLGEKRSGKGKFIELLRNIVKPITVSQIGSAAVLSETLKIWEIEPSRSNLQKLAILMDREFGKGTVTNAVFQRILSDPSDIVIFDGVRWPSDIKKIKTFEKNYVVYVTANPDMRWRRSRLMNEKVGENTASYEQFIDEEKAYTEQFISEIGANADFKIVNEGTLEDFKNEVRRFCKEKLSR